MPWLINALQLDKFRKSQKNVVILDASWHLPTAERDAKAEFLKEHIAGAQWLNLDLFHDSTQLPNMLIRDEQRIAELVGSLGITNEHKIIFYDQSDLRSSCRALWMFKVFGHPLTQLYILDGNFPTWKRFGGKIAEGEAKNCAAKPYTVNFEAHHIRSLMQMKTNVHHPVEQVMDARHPVRYAGGKEAKPGLRPGHIPGSFSFPHMAVFERDGTWKSIDRIRKLFSAAGLDLETPIVTTCGSGITAAVLSTALDLMGQTNHALYDGSWSEWGAEQVYPGEESLHERPVVTSLDT